MTYDSPTGLFTFVSILLIDHFRSRRTVQPVLQVAPAKHDGAPRLQPALVGGFAVPENLRYHPGPTWALNESPNLVRVGLDDFASKLTGLAEDRRNTGRPDPTLGGRCFYASDV